MRLYMENPTLYQEQAARATERGGSPSTSEQAGKAAGGDPRRPTGSQAGRSPAAGGVADAAQEMRA